MKNILFKIGRFPVTSETFIVNHIIMTLELGHDVKILVQETCCFKESRQEELLNKYKIRERIIVQDYDIPISKPRRLVKALLFLVLHITSFRRIYNFYRAKKKFSLTWLYEWVFFQKLKESDIVHVQYGTNHKPIDELKASGSFTMPVVVTFHGHDSFFPINGFIPKKGYYDELFRQGELFTANTPYLREQLIAIDCPSEKIVTVPLPVDTSYFIPKEFKPLTHKNIQLLSVGRLEKIKGHHLGIEAVNELVKKGYKITYKIIGEGSCKKGLQELIAKLSLNEEIILMGALSQREIREYYWEADIFLMTSTVVKGDTRETQGLVALEAQACGCPVIGFKSGGVSYTVKDKESGFLVQEEDVTQFTIKLEKLINDKAMYKSMSLNAPAFVKENYSKKKVSTEWEKIYDAFLEKS